MSSCLQYEAPQLCKLVRDKKFKGTNFESPVYLTVTESIDLDIGDELPDFDDVKLLFISVHLTDGAPNLDFAESVNIELTSSETGFNMPTLRVVDYHRDTDSDLIEKSDFSIIFQSLSSENISKYVNPGPLHFSVTLTGELPQKDWTADIEICISGQSEE